MAKVVCIGECIVDMMPSKDGYIPNAGGAPCNVCACIAKLDGKGCYLGKLGGDEYADFLLEQIKSSGIDCRFVVQDKALKTALAFVDVDENGDRRFTFFRDNTADLNLSDTDVPDDLFDKGDILHFCSLGLTVESEKAHE
ncbi:MAG: PfkB family carbohydrate kinase, partial [Christensenellales bacterium]